MSGVDWYIELTDEEQGQIIALRGLLDIEIRKYDSLAAFLNEVRYSLCDMLDNKAKTERSVRKYYDSIRATEKCTALLSSSTHQRQILQVQRQHMSRQ